MNSMSLLYVLVPVLVLGIGLFVLISLKGGGKKRLNNQWYVEQWKQIEDTFQDGKAGKMLAVVNADKLLDKAMQERGFKGVTMGDRLKSGGTRFSNLNSVWAAHKLRNRIAHESSVQLSDGEIATALSSLKRALQNLGAL